MPLPAEGFEPGLALFLFEIQRKWWGVDINNC